MYDEKQRRLMSSWIEFGSDPTRDAYSQFIGLWIAFNAACYARYCRTANRKRADLRKDKGLRNATAEPRRTTGLIVDEGARVKIELDDPWAVTITIAERYTEELIFNEFATEFQSAYLTWLADPSFSAAIDQLADAIRKPNGVSYVINMAKAEKHDQTDLDELRGTNVVAILDDRTSLRQLKDVLYQVRCNIFHGEKTPGELNDDRITRASLPVLRYLVEHVAA